MKPKLVYMGTPDFAVPPLRRLLELGYAVTGVVCQPDRPGGRHLNLIEPPVKKLARQYGIKVLQPEKVRTPAFEADLRALQPDLVVTAAYGRILPPAILAVPPAGCLNVHASLLPAYRGAAPIQWSLIRGETVTGVTIMLMDEGMDTGPVLARKAMAIPPDMDAGELSDRLSAMGAELLPEIIDRWLAGCIKPTPQDASAAFAIPMLTRDSGAVDWTQPAGAIHNLVRGLYPWPGAFTWCGEKRLKIHHARVNTDPDVQKSAEGMAPGSICLCSRDAISVACGSGVLDLLEIQSDSGKRMLCRDCAHNYRLGQQMGGDQA